MLPVVIGNGVPVLPIGANGRTNPIERDIQAAFDAYAQGLHQLAAGHCERVLELDPLQSDVLHLRGLLAYQAGDVGAALAWLRRADADRVDVLNTLANILSETGQLEEAVALLQRAQALEPDHAGTHSNLGCACQALGRLHDAEAHLRRALAIDPTHGQAHFNLALVLAQMQRVDEAAAGYRAAIAVDARHARAHNNLAVLLQDCGQWDAAKAHLQAALNIEPDYADAHCNLGAVFQRAGDWAAAQQHYTQAQQLAPDRALTYVKVGTLLHEQGKLAAAIAVYQHAIVLDADDADAYGLLGGALQDAGRRDEAKAAYRNALRCNPRHAASRSALRLLLRADCDWAEVEAIDAPLPEGGAEAEGIAPFSLLCAPTTPAQQLRAAQAYCTETCAGMAARVHSRAAPRACLRIGYLSADFRDHPVSHLLAEVFELHDRTQVQVYAYSCHGAGDTSAVRRRISAGVDHFIDLEPLSNQASAQRIGEDQIDILIDLGGYTQFSRTGVMAQRPAPIQVNYLGYPGTMGAPFIDYLITDRFVTPLQAQAHLSEKFVYMPHCFQPNDRQKAVAQDARARPAWDLPPAGFVFCCFNQTYKLTPPVFSVWMRLLQAVAGSVLWLSDTHATAKDSLRREATRHAVDPARLVFAPRVESMAEHLGRQRHADLFLDTLPYNAHTTASDALWAGLPVLTCAGETFASRVAGSLLHAIGLPELVTSSLADYEALALKLAREPGLLQGYRKRLQANRLRMPLFDSARYVKDLERAYQLMWQNHERGLPPSMIEVSA